MGLIEIRHRSERLGNLGGVREADVRTGAAHVLAGMADAAAQDGKSKRALAGVVPDLLDGAKRLALQFAAAQDRRDKEDADRYVARYQQGMDAYNDGSTDQDGKRVPGAMETDFDDSGAWLEGNVDYRDRFGEDLKKKLKMSDRAMEIARRRLVGYNLHMQSSWQARAAKVDDLKAQSAAGERLAAAQSTLLKSLALQGENKFAVEGEDENAVWSPQFALSLDEWRNSVENALDRTHVPEEARPAARRRAALQLCRDALALRIRWCAEDVGAGVSEENVERAYAGLENAVREDGWEGVFPGGPTATDGEGKVVSDPVRQFLEGADMDEFRTAALKDIESARARALHEADARRREEERRTLEGIELVSREAIADGSLPSIEAALARMKDEAGRHPKESRPRVAAMAEAKRLEDAADAAADRDCWDAILDNAAQGAKWEPPKGTRMARRYRRLKDSYDRQAQAYQAEGLLAVDAAVAEERKANVAALRASMLEAAAVSPGGFSARLAEMAERGGITLDQYRRLRDEFRDTWTQKGMPQKAKALVDILKREFYAGRDYDLHDRLAVDPKTGRFGYLRNPDTKRPFEGEDVEYEAQTFVPHDPHDWFGFKDFLMPGSRAAHYETTTRTLTSDEQLELLDIALELAKHDGDETHIDPLTGEPLEKPRVLNSAEEFQRACTMLRKMKQNESAGERILRFAEAQMEVESGFGRFERGMVAAASEREAREAKASQSLKAQKRRPFRPKMPGVRQGADGAEDEKEE